MRLVCLIKYTALKASSSINELLFFPETKCIICFNFKIEINNKNNVYIDIIITADITYKRSDLYSTYGTWRQVFRFPNLIAYYSLLYFFNPM